MGFEPILCFCNSPAINALPYFEKSFQCNCKLYPFKRVVQTASSGHSAESLTFTAALPFMLKSDYIKNLLFCFDNTNFRLKCAIFLHSRNYFLFF